MIFSEADTMGRMRSAPVPQMKRIPRKSLSEINLNALTAICLTAEEDQHLAKGVALFNEGKYWHAHEAWEKIWQKHAEDGRVFFQGLIQLAAAFHQCRRHIFRGFAVHLRQAREKLILFPGNFLGVNVSSLIDAIDANLLLIDRKKSFEEVDPSGIVIPYIQFRENKTLSLEGDS